MEYTRFMKHLNHEFKRSKKFVEETLEIKLTNIELLELKKHVEFTQKIYLLDHKTFLPGKIGGDRKLIIPYIEAALIFMNKNYGTQINFPEGDYEKLNFNKTESKIKLGFNYYSQGFKKIQNEMHNRIGY